MIKCIAIDDEPLALKQITGYISKIPFLELAAEFKSAILAIDFIRENDVDLMFVDINMPDLSGLDFVKSQTSPPKVIFTTAYSEYAIDGFKVNAMDYLLKPIDFDVFLKSVNRAHEWFNIRDKKSSKIESNDICLFIKSEYKVLRINLSDIKYIEGMREYVRIHLVSQRPIMSIVSMKKIEEYLPQDKFMRVHRSYIVNLEKITTIDRNRIVFDNNVYIPISGQYNQKFQEYLIKNFLV
jgi:DNA-binding LytR/AlgR family response regulator